ncbi:MAG: SDR family oxidoreductase [Bacteroidota bacterium]
MNLKLAGKTAFISGSTAGIGFATAKYLLEEGAAVVINGRTEKSVSDTTDKLIAAVPKAKVTGIAADFSQQEAVEKLLQRLPHIDILINNVGIYKAQSFYDTTDEEWYRQFEVNVMSGVRLARYCLPKMLAQNWGRVIFISSECAALVPNDLIAYSMTKTALLSISRGLAQLCKGSKVTVNSVLPGSTLSRGAAQFLADAAAQSEQSRQQVEQEFFTQVRTSSLLQRFATVDEVASTITYLCSPLAAATNGAAIKVDGGSIGGIF